MRSRGEMDSTRTSSWERERERRGQKERVVEVKVKEDGGGDWAAEAQLEALELVQSCQSCHHEKSLYTT